MILEPFASRSGNKLPKRIPPVTALSALRNSIDGFNLYKRKKVGKKIMVDMIE